MSISDGANYAPETQLRAVVAPGEFCFAAAYLDHGHIYGQTKGLLNAGGTLTHVFDPDPEKVSAFRKTFPQAEEVADFEALLANEKLHLIAAAAIPDRRAGIGGRVLQAGKDYFTDKSPFTTLAQLEEVRHLVAQTGCRYFVYYAERVHNEAAWHAGEMIAQGAVGDVIQVLSLAPHRLSASTRPDWFFEKACYGGIITDIGCHQVEQFLTYAHCRDARVNFAAVRNHRHPDTPELEDFGEFSLTGLAESECSFYARIDWYTPAGLPVWGDGRTFILGTEGTLEVRKYVDLARQAPASLVFVANDQGVEEIDCQGRVGYPFFGQMILDVLNRTDKAMTQEHIFKAAEISMQAQALADALRG
jgi:predicted dehydrogenase